MYSKAVRMFLMIVVALTGLAEVAGGIGLLVGWIPLPTEWLQGSPFNSYVIPGLALAILVGGSSLLSAVLLLSKRLLGTLAALAAGFALVIFEVVEFAVVHSVSWMQPFFFGVGVLIVGLAVLLWRVERHRPLSALPATVEERQLTGIHR